MRRFVSAWTGVALAMMASFSPAEISPREAQRFCVDIALLKGGVELRGAVLSRDDSELRMAVQRSWMTARHPELVKQIDEAAVEKQAAARDELQQRIETWKTERAEDARLVAVLTRELERLAVAVDLAEVPGSQFLVVTTPADRVRRVFIAPEVSRQVALIAWRERIERVEETVMGTLKSKVEAITPDWQTQRVDLSARLPSGQSQSANEWSVRQAIFEYEYRERLDFQGTGNLLVRVGEGVDKPDLSSLFAQTAAEALQGELSGLGLDLAATPQTPSDWKSTAIEQAKSLKVKGFRVTRVPKITGSGPASVTVSFFARLSDGTFREIWSNETTTDPATIEPEALDRLQQDPQVQEILKIAKSLSLGQDAQTAVRFGAAVQASLDESDNRFFEFRKRYYQSLDGPPFILPAASQH